MPKRVVCFFIAALRGGLYMAEDVVKKYKKKLILILLSSSDPMTYEELSDRLSEFDVPENFLGRMLKSLENNNIICVEPHDGKDTYILTHFGRRRLSVISKRNKIKEAQRRRKIIIAAVCLVAVILVLVWCLFFVGGNKNQNTPPDGNPSQTEFSSAALNGNLVAGIGQSGDANRVQYETVTMTEDDFCRGNLILVNSDNKLETEPEDLITILGNKNDSYTVSGASFALQKAALDSLNTMMTAYNAETGKSDIRVTSAYRSAAAQQQIYDDTKDAYGESYAKANVQTAGASDSQSGYALAFSEYSGGETSSIKGTAVSEWLEKNACDYGFILRFPEGKDEVTGFAYRAANYRYVGTPHAVYMKENNLALEEYIELLKTDYGYESKHLEIECKDGKYGVYYVSGLTVSVPKNADYTVSGNNSDGFIVTYLISASE